MIILLSLASIILSVSAQNTDGSKVKGCFLPSWGQCDLSGYTPGMCTVAYDAFASVDANSFQVTAPSGAKAHTLKQKDSNLKTVLSIGGGTFPASQWSQIASSDANIKKFAASAIKAAKQGGYDGIDIDWEFPRSAADKKGFTNLVKEIRNEAGANFIITADVPALKENIDPGYDVNQIKSSLSWVNVMTYDFAGPGWTLTSGSNAPLPAVKQSLSDWASAGMPKNQICEGIPFYGHGWKVSDPNAKLGAVGSGPSDAQPQTQSAGDANYNELCSHNNNAKLDSASSTPYVSVNGNLFSYDNAQSVKEKAQAAKNGGYRGAFCWTLCADDTTNKCGGGKFPLMNALDQGLS